MRLLILTDHSRHTIHNSLYTLADALEAHDEILSVHVATRGDDRNHDFFEGRTVGFLAVDHQGNLDFPSDEKFRQSGFETELSNYDRIFLRLPHPINDKFFPFLIQNFPERHIINRPSGIIKTSNKGFLVNVSKYTPPIQLCENWDQILEFREQFECVLKPLESYGGQGLIRIQNEKVWIDGENISLKVFSKKYHEAPQSYLAMKFLKNVVKGDKRIVVVGGEVLVASLRLPAEGSWLCNVAQGGSSAISEADPREMEIVDYLSPILREEGIFYYGLDTLCDDSGKRVISEINTLSIGGIAPIESTLGLPLSDIFAERFVKYCKE